MRLTVRGMTVLLLALVPAAAWAGTAVGVSVGVTDGPVTMRLSINTRPEMVYVREQAVYVAQDPRCDDDVFRCGSMWWVMRDEHWYRATDWRGTFVRVRERDVPAALWRVPERHWRHHPHGMPPGQARKADMAEMRGHGRGHEHVRERDRD